MNKRKSAAFDVYEDPDGELVIRQHVMGTDDTFVCVPVHQIDWLIEQIKAVQQEIQTAKSATNS